MVSLLRLKVIILYDNNSRLPILSAAINAKWFNSRSYRNYPQQFFLHYMIELSTFSTCVLFLLNRRIENEFWRWRITFVLVIVWYANIRDIHFPRCDIVSIIDVIKLMDDIVQFLVVYLQINKRWFWQ